MIYDMVNTEGVLGTFSTRLSATKATEILKQCYGDLVLVEQGGLNFKNRFYVYRFVNQQYDNIAFLGHFDTNMSMIKAWDIMFTIFNGDSPDGIFVRKEKIC